MIKSRLIAQCLVVSALSAGLACAAVTPGQIATPLVRQNALNDAVVTAGPNGETIVTFGARPTGTYQEITRVDAVANLGVASGAFVGNYPAAGIVSVKFKVATDGHVPADFSVVLAHGSEAWQSRTVQLSSTPGEWVQNTVGFDRADDQWQYAVGRGVNPDVAWQVALNDVNALGLRIQSEYNNDAQTVMIKDFVLVDSDGTEHPGNLTPLGNALWARFRVGKIADVGAQGALDSDNDGVSDLNEVLAGTDENDGQDKFIAEVLEVTDSGVTIRWASAVEWATYNVYRSTSLADGFALVGEGLTLANVTVVDGQSVWLDESASSAGAPYFYKVVEVIEGE
ncbi:MAG: hypothetical protein HQ523_15800 [Lentisphaerae bacterium]|nr:hypothetical protein [Lentisphaerota bacterium]